MLGMVEKWSKLLASGMPEEERKSFSLREKSGEPMGVAEFVGKLEAVVGRSLKAMGPGRPTKLPKNSYCPSFPQAFQKRRKQLRNCLKQRLPEPDEVFAAVGLTGSERPEELSTATWIELANQMG